MSQQDTNSRVLVRNIDTPRPCDMDRLDRSQLRDSFLVGDLFETGKARFVITDLDRLLVGGITPDGDIALPHLPQLGSRYFTERRELGVINIGGQGRVTVGDRVFDMGRLDCLYVGKGEEQVVFHSEPSGTAAYYVLSCPAHFSHPTRKATSPEACIQQTGSAETASRRTIYKYIHPDGIESAQLVMGFTELERGSAWNTMPAHTHRRRTEVYLYFDVGDNFVMHLVGEPSRTRHLIVRDRQAVLSPSWSLHSGAGTSSYKFIWGMAGENQDFSDMDPVTLAEIQ